MIRSMEDWAISLVPSLYKERVFQTLWNCPDPERRKKGWEFVGRMWSPAYFNIRILGNFPALFVECCSAMADLISRHDFDLIIAVEMAAIQFSGGTAFASLLNNGIGRRVGFTRPLPKKPRTPAEAVEILRGLEGGVATYGQKDFVEAIFSPNDRVAISDDVATNLGSKITARLIVLWTAERLGISVTCDKIFYFWNWRKENRQAGIDFAEEPNQSLYPGELTVDYVVEFTRDLPALKNQMHPEEFQVMSDFQANSNQFQDKAVQREVLASAAKTRKGKEA